MKKIIIIIAILITAGAYVTPHTSKEIKEPVRVVETTTLKKPIETTHKEEKPVEPIYRGASSEPAAGVYAVYSDESMTRENIMGLINKQRVSHGLGKVATNQKLNVSACEKLDDMVKYDYWAHNSPSGVTPWHWFQVAGYNYSRAGENLAYGQSTPSATATQWMNSPAHRDNILGNFKEQGLCVKYVHFQGVSTYLTVSHFGSR